MDKFYTNISFHHQNFHLFPFLLLHWMHWFKKLILRKINVKRVTYLHRRFQLRLTRNKADTCKYISPEYLCTCHTDTTVDSHIHRYLYNFHLNHPTCSLRCTRSGTYRIYSHTAQIHRDYWTSRTRLYPHKFARYFRQDAWSPFHIRIEMTQGNWDSVHFHREYCHWRIHRCPCRHSHRL